MLNENRVLPSGPHLRLLLKRCLLLEGQRHMSTVPMKLIGTPNDHYAKHIECFFCKETIRHLKELVSMLGQNECSL